MRHEDDLEPIPHGILKDLLLNGLLKPPTANGWYHVTIKEEIPAKHKTKPQPKPVPKPKAEHKDTPAFEVPERIVFNNPVTIAYWTDGTKTIARCSEDDTFEKYIGLLVCIAKRNLRPLPKKTTFTDIMDTLIDTAEDKSRPQAEINAKREARAKKKNS